MAAKTTDRWAVFGQTGSGKSSFLKSEVLKGQTRVVIFDVADEYAREKIAQPAESLAAVRDQIAAGWQQGFRVAYNPFADPAAGKDATLALHRLARFLWEVQAPYHDRPRPDRKILLLIEEAAKAAPNEKLPADRRMFEQLVFQGRHRGIDMALASQRPASVNYDYRSQAGISVYFRLEEKNDVQAALERLGREWESTLRGLQTHEYLRLAGGQVEKGRNRV
jgi:DNA helicase HerA-like ATPase